MAETIEPSTWVDERPLPGASGGQAWWPLQPGDHTVRVHDAEGRSDSLTLQVVGRDARR